MDVLRQLQAAPDAGPHPHPGEGDHVEVGAGRPVPAATAPISTQPAMVAAATPSPLDLYQEDTTSAAAAAFECNICLELAKDPVVTLCGHLYCWPCLYRWMQVQSYCRQCPVCKAGVEVDKVVPIYGRGSDDDRAGQRGGAADDDPATALKQRPLPPRPIGQRPLPVQVGPMGGGQGQGHIGGGPGGGLQGQGLQGQAAAQQGGGNAGAGGGGGVLPALFGFQLGPGQGYVEALTPEQQHQAFLSRLLLMLGSFVIMCLLLF